MLRDLGESECLIVDLTRVVNVSNAAARLLLRLADQLATERKRLHFTGTLHLYGFRRLLQKADSVKTADWLRYDDTDHAVEACEQRVIDAAGLHTGASDAADLRELFLCRGLSDKQLDALRASGTERQFPPGATVVSAGDTALSFFVVLSGEAVVWLGAGGKSRSVRKVRLKTLGPATVFGEFGIMDAAPRSANVTADTALTCLEVPYAALTPPIRERMLANMARHFATLLRENAELVRHLA
jgi:glutaminase